MDEIMLEGIIVNDDDAWIYKWFGYTVFTPKALRAALKAANGGPVTLRVNSSGGEVTSASVIYTDLREYAGEVTVKIVGMAASAASVISMAGDKVLMSPTAEMMIHTARMGADGDHRDMERAAGILKSTDDAIVNAYLGKTDKLTHAQLKAMMEKETWFNASEAQEHGLIDAVMFQDGAAPKDDAAKDEHSGGMPGARAAALNLPSVPALKERKRVWDDLAPGAKDLAEARAALASSTPSANPKASAVSEPICAPKLDPALDPMNNEASLALLRAQIDIYGEV